MIAINLGRESKERSDELRIRVDAVLADATATLERLGVAHAISEARMRSQTDQLREALIGSVSHELRTPLASILGAATVLSAAPALPGEKKLRRWCTTCATKPNGSTTTSRTCSTPPASAATASSRIIEWADPDDIINSAIERCRHRLADRRVVAQSARRPAAGPCRSGAGAAGAGADFRQRGEIFQRRLADHGVPRAPATAA